MPKKFPLILAAAAVLAFAAVAHAQEQTPSVPPAQNAATGTPSATTSTDASLFPDAGSTPPNGQPSTGGGRRRNGQGGGRGRRGSSHATDAALQQADQAPLAVRVSFRQAKTEAMVRDPGLADLLVEADRSPTEEVKRSYLREYYTRLYALVRKIDPSPEMKTHVDLLTQVASQRYDPKRRALGDADDLTNGTGRKGKRKR